MPQHNENTGDAIPTSDLNITTTTLEKKEDATAKEKSISTDDTTVDDITMIRQRLKRKLDIRLAVWSMVAFLAVFIDKSNMRMYDRLYSFYYTALIINTRTCIHATTSECLYQRYERRSGFGISCI